MTKTIESINECGYRYLPEVAARYLEALTGNKPGEAEAAVLEIAANAAALAYAQGRGGKPLGSLFPFLRPIN